MMSYMLMLAILSSLISMMITMNHLLSSLLALEMASLALILLMFTSYLNQSPHTSSLNMLIILTLGACEASIMLSCLTSTTSIYGQDSLNNLSALVPC